MKKRRLAGKSLIKNKSTPKRKLTPQAQAFYKTKSVGNKKLTSLPSFTE